MLIGIRHVMCWHILRRRGGEGEREEEREREEVKGEMKEEGGEGVHMLFFFSRSRNINIGSIDPQ